MWLAAGLSILFTLEYFPGEIIPSEIILDSLRRKNILSIQLLFLGLFGGMDAG